MNTGRGTVMQHMGAHARRRMDERYRRLGPLSEMGRPHRGWIRAVRDALGMSGHGTSPSVGCQPAAGDSARTRRVAVLCSTQHVEAGR